ncbi:hypothetical protein [Erwinia sorbitola]|uniref:Uncharacterized protein n=1 Tax=Erwinia sorbitola TaxID=2681984 RepID=A0A6I6EMU8_9GAMM|nr:hypothetical protein [Erwinia sorbitola]QGU85922.1 hypothetical protein GN242_01185 [Erwinia sorbitola]
MKMKEIETKYGVIFGRNALILSNTDLNFHPFKLAIKASLSLSACRPAIMNYPDVDIQFLFDEIESLSIYKIDDYPYEKYTESSFDEVEGVYKNGRKRIVLSTYDHVFDVVGKYKLKYE